MPVRKFRSVEDMNAPVWRAPGDPALYVAIGAVWERGARLSPRRFTPGVRRFTSIAALEADADALTETTRQ